MEMRMMRLMRRVWQAALFTALFVVLPALAYAQSPPTEAVIPGVGRVFTGVTRFLGPTYLGPKGTPLSQGVMVFSQVITPTATAAAIGTVSQNVTVTGLPAGAAVSVTGPAPTALCPLVGARAGAANTLTLEFSVLTAAACTPASGTYQIVAVK